MRGGNGDMFAVVELSHFDGSKKELFGGAFSHGDTITCVFGHTTLFFTQTQGLNGPALTISLDSMGTIVTTGAPHTRWHDAAVRVPSTVTQGDDAKAVVLRATMPGASTHRCFILTKDLQHPDTIYNSTTNTYAVPETQLIKVTPMVVICRQGLVFNSMVGGSNPFIWNWHNPRERIQNDFRPKDISVMDVVRRRGVKEEEGDDEPCGGGFMFSPAQQLVKRRFAIINDDEAFSVEKKRPAPSSESDQVVAMNAAIENLPAFQLLKTQIKQSTDTAALAIQRSDLALVRNNEEAEKNKARHEETLKIQKENHDAVMESQKALVQKIEAERKARDEQMARDQKLRDEQLAQAQKARDEENRERMREFESRLMSVLQGTIAKQGGAGDITHN